MVTSEEDIKIARERMDRIIAGISDSSISAVINARRHNSKIISWKDGKIVEIDPYTIDIDEDKEN